METAWNGDMAAKKRGGELVMIYDVGGEIF